MSAELVHHKRYLLKDIPHQIQSQYNIGPEIEGVFIAGEGFMDFGGFSVIDKNQRKVYIHVSELSGAMFGPIPKEQHGV